MPAIARRHGGAWIEIRRLRRQPHRNDAQDRFAQAQLDSRGGAPHHADAARAAEVDHLAEIEADPDKIMQILLNLLSNAIKFTSKGSVEINLRRVDRHSVLSVKDTGIGINKSDINKLFNKFFRAEDAQSRNIGGTGL